VTGLDLFLDLDAIDDDGVQRAKKRLSEALLALSVRGQPWPVTGGAGSAAS
jgi:hypothetical protein